MKNTMIAAAIVTVAVASPLYAQADTNRAVLRVEAHAGWDRSKFGGHKDGVLYGLGAGVDFPVGRNMFLGLDANAEDSSVKMCARNVAEVSDRLCVRTGRDLSIGARFGTTLTNGVKIYALGAYTNARLKLTYSDSTGRDSAGSNLDGWRIGGGAQLPINDQLFAKAEYRYSNYEDGYSRHQVLGGFGLNF